MDDNHSDVIRQLIMTEIFNPLDYRFIIGMNIFIPAFLKNFQQSILSKFVPAFVKYFCCSIGIEKKYGKATYVVEIDDDGEEIDVIIDIETGAVLGVED